MEQSAEFKNTFKNLSDNLYRILFSGIFYSFETWKRRLSKYLSDETRLFQSSKGPKYKNPKITFI